MAITGRAIRRTTITRTDLLREDQLQWAKRPIITTQTVRRRGLPPEWATRHTTMVRMARRPVRPPERAGNSGLNVVPSGGMQCALWRDVVIVTFVAIRWYSSLR